MRISKSKMGIKHTKKHNDNISKSMVGKLVGYKHSKATRIRMSLAKKGKRTALYKAIGTITIYNGYYWIKETDKTWKQLHRYLVEVYINRKLKPNETVHHIDGNKLNNRLRNLYIFKNRHSHNSFSYLVKYKIINKFILKSNLREFKHE